MSQIVLSGVSYCYPGTGTGLHGIDLSVGDGELVALVGPSGSGKTTLLRTIAGFLSPDQGSVVIGGREVAGPGVAVPPERRRLGMVFQQQAIWPHWNVGRNVGYPLWLAGVGRAERARRVAEVLDLVGLPGAERRNPATLSGGQRQRVALARALAPAPQVLLLDEALSALDEPLRAHLRTELRALVGRLGLTVVHVTHDRSEALALADRVVVMDGGRVAQVGSPEDLVHRPDSPFVASFLSDATVVDGRLTADGFVGLDGNHRVPLQSVREGERPVGPPPGSEGEQGRLAVLPQGVRLTPVGDGAAQAGGSDPVPVVTSSLYGRDRHDMVVDWCGVELRVAQPGMRLAAGTRVRVEVDGALFYRADPAAARPAAVVPAAGVGRTEGEPALAGSAVADPVAQGTP